MSKKKNRGFRHGQTTAGHTELSPQKPAIDSRVTEIQAAHGEARGVMIEADATAISTEPRPNGADLDALWGTVREARDLFRAVTQRSSDSLTRTEELRRLNEAKAAKLNDQEVALKRVQGEVEALKATLTEETAALERDKKALAAKQAGLVARETALRERELNAEAGFVTERQAALAALQESATALREEIAATERAIAGERAAWLAEQQVQRKKQQEELRSELEIRRTTAEQDLTKREDELAQREHEVQRARIELDGLRLQLDYEGQHLNEVRQNLGRRVDQNAAAVREELEHRISALQAQLEQARKDRDAHQSALREREETDRRFGQRTPSQVLKELEKLRDQRDQLKAALDERPDAQAAARLEQLEIERATWEAERLDMQRRLAEKERRLAHVTISAVELETVRDQKTALESSRAVLHQAITELTSEVNTLISRADAKAPFPACSEMDADQDLQVQGPIDEAIGDLAAFAKDLQHRIAFDPKHPERLLYYSLEDVRNFLAGLAMGPLVLLQGISGTGKTSLPIAFARAMGTKATVVEVQAGWRDPQDLVGHYNVFEKRFYEKEFLKGLYRARTRRFADTIQIIVLDEMNLSHPEQYFSDMLSALELKPEDRRLVLVPHAIAPAPSLFEGGSTLPLPPNVWFVGTANHDETTKDFADKTYDRAQVMQFPQRPTPFDVNKQLNPRPPVSFKALRRAFDDASKRHAKSADEAIGFFECVREPLGHYFEIGWGPRLERQLRRYVPVVVAAGGSVGEATDHLLAMRLLRKLKNRHDNRREHLEALRQRIEDMWPNLDPESRPQRSTEVLISELRRLGWTPEERE